MGLPSRVTSARHECPTRLPFSKDPCGGAEKGDRSVQTGSLIEVIVDALNGIEDEVE